MKHIPFNLGYTNHLHTRGAFSSLNLWSQSGVKVLGPSNSRRARRFLDEACKCEVTCFKRRVLAEA